MSENASIEVGKKLHDARVAKGMTLDDLQQATKIQKRYLIAIEDEKFDELPGDFYVRAFVKQYADTVGLDGNDLLQEFNDQLPETKSSEYSKHIEQAVETRTGQHKTVDQIDRVRQYMSTVIVVVVIIVVLGAIWLTAIHSDHRSSQSNIDSSSVSVSGESSKKESSTAGKKSSSNSSNSATKVRLTSVTRTSSAATFKVENAKSQKYTLSVAPSERAWVAVTGDGSSLFSKTMTANSKQNVKINKSVARVVLTLGNAKSTVVKLNGKTVDVTDNNKYPNVRTVTIVLSGSTATTTSSSSSAASSSSSSTSAATSTSSSASSTAN